MKGNTENKKKVSEEILKPFLVHPQGFEPWTH